MNNKEILKFFTASGLVFATLFSSASPGQETSKDYVRVDANKPVICLLPGKVRKLGGRMTYLERRRPTELTASECEIRGGEYTFYDRANYQTALTVWREAAEAGDPTAQIYVGEIFEKGWTGEPDYEEAARWYQLALDQGDRRGQRRLAYFYENGLGVDRDPSMALGLWRDALDLSDDLVLASDLEAAKTEAQRQTETLVAELQEQNLKTARLQSSLSDQQAEMLAQQQVIETIRVQSAQLENQLAQVEHASVDTAELEKLKGDLSASEKVIREKSLSLELLSAQMGAQRAQIEASARQAQLRELKLEDAQRALSEEAARGDVLLVELESQSEALAALESQLSRARSDLASSRNEEQLLSEQIRSRKQQGQSDSETESQLRRELSAASERAERKEAQVAELERQFQADRGTLTSALADSNLRETELADALEESRQEKSALVATLAQREQQLRAKNSELSEVQGELAVARIDQSDLQEALANTSQSDQGKQQELMSKLASQKTLIDGLEQDNLSLTSSLETLAAQREDLRRSLTGEVDWLRAEVEQEKARVLELQAERDTFAASLDQAEQEKQRLTGQVARLRTDLQRSNNSNQNEVELIESQLALAQNNLNEKTAEVHELLRAKARLEGQLQYDGGLRLTQLATRSGGTGIELSRSDIQLPKNLGMDKYRFSALIIANYEYQHITDLNTPQNDALQLKKLLEENYGFDVRLGINLSRSELLENLNSLQQFGDRDFVLVYYAGHGRMDEFDDAYWLPTDYREGERLSSSAISSSDITSFLQRSPAKHVMLVADSCYSGAMLRKSSPVIQSNSNKLVKYWVQNRSRTVLTSGGLKPVLDEGFGDHSVFANGLLSVLTESTGPINGQMLHAAVQGRVQREAAMLGYFDQIPQFASIEDAGHANGQFLFVPNGI